MVLFSHSLICLSRVSISTSLFMVLFSRSLIPLTILSASLDMLASLKMVTASFSVWILNSSSIKTHLLVAALTSSSLSLNSFSASSILLTEDWSFSIVSSMLVSSLVTRLELSRMSASNLSLMPFASLVASSYSEIFLYKSSVSAFIDCIFFLMASIFYFCSWAGNGLDRDCLNDRMLAKEFQCQHCD